MKFMKKYDIVPIAYCPVARGIESVNSSNGKEIGTHLYANKTLNELAEKYKKSCAQIMLNWGLQRGHILIPKSNSIERQQENIDCLSFKLTDEEVAALTAIDAGARLCTGENHFPGGNVFG